MKSIMYFCKDKSGLITKICLFASIALISTNPTRAHQEDELAVQQSDGDKPKVIEVLCGTRDKEDLLEIIASNRHDVLFYDTHGNQGRHIDNGGQIKLKVVGESVKRIRMFKQGQRRSELDQKVKATVTHETAVLGDILSIKAETKTASTNRPELPHKYEFDFYVPCAYESVGYFMFDFADINSKKEKVTIDADNNIIGGPGGNFSHSRGTGGGQSN